MRKLVVSFAVVAVLVACATERTGRTKLADGSYHLSCKEPLTYCLSQFTEMCSRYGYDVIRAREEKRHYGPSLWEAEYISSDAIVRCRSPEALIGGKSPPAAASSGAPATKAAGHCFPGTTQACLGPGACKGAQTCRDDGTRFSPCDCGNAAPAASPAPDETLDAGTSSWGTPNADAGAP